MDEFGRVWVFVGVILDRCDGRSCEGEKCSKGLSRSLDLDDGRDIFVSFRRLSTQDEKARLMVCVGCIKGAFVCCEIKL